MGHLYVNVAVLVGNTALHLASTAGMTDVASSLIGMGATVSAADCQGYTPLQRACQRNLASVARLLIIQGGASPHLRVPDTGNSLLHLAAERGHLETVRVCNTDSSTDSCTT